MRTETQIEKETDYLGFGVLNAKGDDYDYFSDMSDEEIVALAKELKVNPRLLFGLKSFVEDIQKTIGADLEAIWKRMDKMEK